jgi:hypothetical protein
MCSGFILSLLYRPSYDPYYGVLTANIKPEWNEAVLTKWAVHGWSLGCDESYDTSSLSEIINFCLVYIRVFLSRSLSLGGVRLSPLGTSATVFLLYQPRMIDDDYGAVGGMRIGRGSELSYYRF